MEEIAYRYPFACEVLNTYPLGVFSWVPQAVLGYNCAEIRMRETLKYILGISIREDFESFAESSRSFKVDFSPNTKFLNKLPTIEDKLSELENSISESENKNAELEIAIKKLNSLRSQEFSSCVGFLEDFFKGLAKEGKKAVASSINKWSKLEAKK